MHVIILSNNLPICGQFQYNIYNTRRYTVSKPSCEKSNLVFSYDNLCSASLIKISTLPIFKINGELTFWHSHLGNANITQTRGVTKRKISKKWFNRTLLHSPITIKLYICELFFCARTHPHVKTLT